MVELNEQEKYISDLIDHYLFNFDVNKKEFVDRLNKTIRRYQILANTYKDVSYKSPDEEIIALKLALLKIKHNKKLIEILSTFMKSIKLIDGYLTGHYIAADFVERFSNLFLSYKENVRFLKPFYEAIQFFTTSPEWSAEDPNLFSDESKLKKMSEEQKRMLIQKWSEALNLKI